MTINDFFDYAFDKFEKEGKWRSIDRLNKRLFGDDKDIVDIKQMCVVSFDSLPSSELVSFLTKIGFTEHKSKWQKLIVDEEDLKKITQDLRLFKRQYWGEAPIWFAVFEMMK